ncbi:DUF2637 domain-containing protein [Nocardiopsis alborubida]|uniref:DUF2637 domain-containing protein n=1 Tax=Nocardiopsis alborubida TaxID=146802 RepID=A0A7X6RRZ7_9ACTN|nr:DUF2637 domain-containing protein [Nocardiopsis alborubida]NKZ00134.1 DUF2637 domain-containing protein [Nocardiopsis alborubida]
MKRLASLSADWAPILVLAGIAAAGSFTHIRDLAEKSGQHGWMAWAVAVSIDLTCVMAARERQRDAARGVKDGVTWPTVVLVGAVVLTLAANLATAQPTVWGWIMAAVPAAAFLVAVSMLERRAAHSAPEPPEPAPAEPVTSEHEEFRVTEVHWQHTEPAPAPAPQPPPAPVAPVPQPAPAAVEQGHPLASYAAQLAQDYRVTHGREITVTALRSRLGVSETVAATLRDQITT